MRNVLIIGGTGTISTPIAKRLAGDPETRLYILNRGKHPGTLPEGAIHLKADINNTEEAEKALGTLHFDTVINFVVMSEEAAEKNIALFQGRTEQFIFISTVVTLDHRYTVSIDECSAKTNVISAYGKTKAACEEIFLKAKEETGFPVTIVRPTQTYSDSRIPLSVKGKSCWSVIDRMLKGKEVIVHGDGQGVWASTHAEDFAEGFLPLVGRTDSIGEIYQIMNPQPHTWDMVYKTLADLLGVEYRPVYISTMLLSRSRFYNLEESIHGDKHFSNIFNIDKIRKAAPEFTCRIDLETGLRMYLQYMEEHPSEKKADPDFDAWCDETIRLYHRLEKEFAEEIR